MSIFRFWSCKSLWNHVLWVRMNKVVCSPELIFLIPIILQQAAQPFFFFIVVVVVWCNFMYLIWSQMVLSFLNIVLYFQYFTPKLFFYFSLMYQNFYSSTSFILCFYISEWFHRLFFNNTKPFLCIWILLHCRFSATFILVSWFLFLFYYPPLYCLSAYVVFLWAYGFICNLALVIILQNSPLSYLS